MDIFTEFNNENTEKLRGGTIRVLRSTDKGASWSGPFLIDRLGTIGDHRSRDRRSRPDGRHHPGHRRQPANGELYAVWQDARFNGGQSDSIAFSQSLDGGLTWSTPIKVNQTPTGSRSGTSRRSRRPWRSRTTAPSASPTTTSATTRRSDTLLTDYFVVHCHPTTATACTTPSTGATRPGSRTRPSTCVDAPFAGGFFTGDYEGLAATGDFLAFFSQPHGSDPSSAFFRRVGP